VGVKRRGMDEPMSMSMLMDQYRWIDVDESMSMSIEPQSMDTASLISLENHDGFHQESNLAHQPALYNQFSANSRCFRLW
jgi:hypothetical protein